MPNQLAPSKRRQSLAEHEVVLAAFGEIARSENTTVMALLREAARELVKAKSSNPDLKKRLQDATWAMAPTMPSTFQTAAQVARFKRRQRAFDEALLEMALTNPAEIQLRNSIAHPDHQIQIVDFDKAHAETA